MSFRAITRALVSRARSSATLSMIALALSACVDAPSAPPEQLPTPRADFGTSTPVWDVLDIGSPQGTYGATGMDISDTRVVVGYA